MGEEQDVEKRKEGMENIKGRSEGTSGHNREAKKENYGRSHGSSQVIRLWRILSTSLLLNLLTKFCEKDNQSVRFSSYRLYDNLGRCNDRLAFLNLDCNV